MALDAQKLITTHVSTLALSQFLEGGLRATLTQRFTKLAHLARKSVALVRTERCRVQLTHVKLRFERLIVFVAFVKKLGESLKILRMSSTVLLIFLDDLRLLMLVLLDHFIGPAADVL